MRTDLANIIIEYGAKNPDEYFDGLGLRRVLCIDDETIKRREAKNNIVPLIEGNKRLYRGAQLRGILTHTKK